MPATTRTAFAAAGAAVVWLLTATAWGQSADTIDGFSHPQRSAEVAASTSGTIVRWLVAEGQSVAAGEPLVELDDTVHRAVIAIAESAVASRGEWQLATAEQKLRKQRLDAIERLAEQSHATADELLRARSEWEIAAARVLAANENRLRRRLELEKLQAQSKSFVVVAPFDGVVTKLHRQPGEYVGPVDPVVCEVVELKNLSARFLVPSGMVEGVSQGSPVGVLFVSSGIEATGVATVSPYPDAETGMRSVSVRIANPRCDLPAGVRCRLLLGHRRSLPDEPDSSATASVQL